LLSCMRPIGLRNSSIDGGKTRNHARREGRTLFLWARKQVLFTFGNLIDTFPQHCRQRSGPAS